MPLYGDLIMHVVLDLRRGFTSEQLTQALIRTIECFPVLGCRYEARLRRDSWVPVTTPISEALIIEGHVDLEPRTEFWLRQPIVASTQRQVRVVALEHESQLRLLVSVLHLAVDGAGLAAVGHVLGAYLYDGEPSLPVESRRDFWRTVDGLRWFHWPLALRSVVQSALLPLRQQAAAPREKAYPAAVRGEANWRTIVISASQLAKLRQRCDGATINDLLVAVMARVAAVRSTSGPVVVTYTMDLRRYGAGPRLIAANVSAVLAALVPRHALSSLPSTVRAVATQTAVHRNTLAGPALVLLIKLLCGSLPHTLVRQLVRPLAIAAVDLPLSRGVLITNVGRIDDGLAMFGDDLVGIRIVGPTTNNFPVPLVVAFGFRGELHLQLYAGPQLAASSLDELAAEILHSLSVENVKA